jgi:UDP-glucose 4-epimerase
LVLGGAGFIGSHIVEALQAQGHVIHLLDARPSAWWTPPTNVRCWWGDWNDATLLAAAMQKVEVVIHLISTSMPASSNQNIPLDVEANLMATLRLLELSRANGIRRVVFASSGGTVYGVPQFTPITEQHPTQPLNSYGIVKLTCEHYLRLYHQLHGLEYIILRGANPYGERQNPKQAQGAIGVFLGQIARRAPITIWGDGNVIRDYFHVSDMAQAFVLAATCPLASGLFNVGSGHGVSLNELLTRIATATGQKPEVQYTAARGIDVPVNVLAIQHIQNTLGWQPRIDLDSGLRRTWDWMQTVL